jgi:hypothetical protein
VTAEFRPKSARALPLFGVVWSAEPRLVRFVLVLAALFQTSLGWVSAQEPAELVYVDPGRHDDRTESYHFGTPSNTESQETGRSGATPYPYFALRGSSAGSRYSMLHGPIPCS